MKVHIRKTSDRDAECVIIECIEVTSEIENIRAYVLAQGAQVLGNLEGRTYQLNLRDVYYFEAVGERVFAYMSNQVYEVKGRLYEIEEAYSTRHFIRCSKSFVINLMKLASVSPALNGRFAAHMKNGETVIISRQYVPKLKQAVMGGGL